MRVTKVVDAQAGQPGVELVDDVGVPVADVAGFLRLLTVQDYSPNTVRAYAYDLQKLYRFLHERGLTVGEFRPAQALIFIEWLRTRSSSRKAQRLDLALTAGNGRLLAAKTCNRVLAAVSSFFEYLISIERYGGADNPIVTIPDQAAARVPGRPRAPLMTSSPQRPVRRALRIKTVESLPRPMSDDTYVAVLGVLRTRRDRALLELMWEGGLRPGEVLGLRLEASPTDAGESWCATGPITRQERGRNRAGTGPSTCLKAGRCRPSAITSCTNVPPMPTPAMCSSSATGTAAHRGTTHRRRHRTRLGPRDRTTPLHRRPYPPAPR
ncbi:site-specific integrase [Micromonospora echinospora]|uniref:site-specific integrase n=1 Tax=Micromonospora echinospora TaxID=1877 RepID=UPI003CF2E85F